MLKLLHPLLRPYALLETLLRRTPPRKFVERICRGPAIASLNVWPVALIVRLVSATLDEPIQTSSEAAGQFGSNSAAAHILVAHRCARATYRTVVLPAINLFMSCVCFAGEVVGRRRQRRQCPSSSYKCIRCIERSVKCSMMLLASTSTELRLEASRCLAFRAALNRRRLLSCGRKVGSVRFGLFTANAQRSSI